MRRVWRARSRVRWRASWLRERERALSSGASARLAVWCRVSERRSEEQASRMLAQAHSPQKSDTSPLRSKAVGRVLLGDRDAFLPFAVCLWPFAAAAAAAAAAASAERRTSNSSLRKVGEARSTRLADRREWADSGGAGWAGADGGDVERRERRTVCRPSERLPSGRSELTIILQLLLSTRARRRAECRAGECTRERVGQSRGLSRARAKTAFQKRPSSHN